MEPWIAQRRSRSASTVVMRLTGENSMFCISCFPQTPEPRVFHRPQHPVFTPTRAPRRPSTLCPVSFTKPTTPASTPEYFFKEWLKLHHQILTPEISSLSVPFFSCRCGGAKTCYLFPKLMLVFKFSLRI